jgi:hypothetical protein
MVIPGEHRADEELKKAQKNLSLEMMFKTLSLAVNPKLYRNLTKDLKEKTLSPSMKFIDDYIQNLADYETFLINVYLNSETRDDFDKIENAINYAFELPSNSITNNIDYYKQMATVMKLDEYEIQEETSHIKSCLERIYFSLTKIYYDFLPSNQDVLITQKFFSHLSENYAPNYPFDECIGDESKFDSKN